MVAYLYDFNGTDTTSGVPSPDGHPVLEEVSGTWRRLSNRAYTSTSRNSSPILAAPVGGGDVDVSASVSSGGGDAIYVRVTDAANWIRARVRKYTVSGGYYSTEYEWEGGFYYGGSGYEHTHYSTAWSSSNSSCPHSSGYIHSHLVSGDNLSHSHSRISCTLTGNTRQVWNSTSSTAYQVILEKSANGTVTTLGTASASAPSSLRVRAQGTSLQVYVNGAASASVTANEFAFTTANKHGVGRGPSDQDGQALDNLSLDPINTAPNAPPLIAPADGAILDRASTLTFDWNFSDPDTGDSQSKFNLYYRLIGAPSWTTITGTTPNTYHDMAAGTLAAGDHEWQVETFDAQGALGARSSSRYFTAADAPTGHSITAPTNGGTVDQFETVTWSTPDQEAHQLRRVADNAGTADEATVHYDTGEVVSVTTRNRAVEFETNDRYEHIQVRIKDGGLWSDWASVRVLVSYTPPPAPTVTPAASNADGAVSVTTETPAPAEGEPTVEYVDLYVRDTTGRDTYRPTSGIRWAMFRVPNGVTVDWKAASGINYEYQAVAHGNNGTTAASAWTAIDSDAVATIYYGGDGY